MEDHIPISRPKINCENHGVKDYCLICRHLRNNSGLGFYAGQAEVDYPAQAWCEGCDQILEQQRGWNDYADEIADWKLFCEDCYEETLSRHELIAFTVGTDDD